ncbi:hypothetical protein SAMN05518669_104393, partial [Variovorax sp. YR634]
GLPHTGSSPLRGLLQPECRHSTHRCTWDLKSPLLSFGEAKESKSPAGARPGLGRQNKERPSSPLLRKSKKQGFKLLIPRQPSTEHPNPMLSSRITQPKRRPRQRQFQRIDTTLTSVSRSAINKQPMQHRIKPQRIQIPIKPFQRSLRSMSPPLQRHSQRLPLQLPGNGPIELHSQGKRKVPPHPIDRRHQHPDPRLLPRHLPPQRKAPDRRFEVSLSPIRMPIPQPGHAPLQPLIPHGTKRLRQPPMRKIPHARQLAEPPRQRGRGKERRR